MNDYNESYIETFLKFYMEVLEYAEVVWENNFDQELLLECTLDVFPCKDDWNSVNVLHNYKLQIEKRKKK